MSAIKKLKAFDKKIQDIITAILALGIGTIFLQVGGFINKQLNESIDKTNKKTENERPNKTILIISVLLTVEIIFVIYGATFVFKTLIMGAMLYGSYTDLKTRTVSNKIIAIILTGAAGLIIIKWPPQITIIHIVLIFATFIAYKVRALGAADLKAIIPLIFTMSAIQLYIFIILATLIHTYIHFRIDKNTPYFTAITGAFLLIG